MVFELWLAVTRNLETDEILPSELWSKPQSAGFYLSEVLASKSKSKGFFVWSALMVHMLSSIWCVRSWNIKRVSGRLPGFYWASNFFLEELRINRMPIKSMLPKAADRYGLWCRDPNYSDGIKFDTLRGSFITVYSFFLGLNDTSFSLERITSGSRSDRECKFQKNIKFRFVTVWPRP